MTDVPTDFPDPEPFDFDWRHPNYVPVFQARIQNLLRIRERPERLPQLRAYYASGPDGICDFISDWGITFDPRNADIGMPTVIPFILFPKQRDWVHWVWDRWKSRRPGLCEKSRDMGISWLGTSMASTMCLFHEGLAIGFGSRVVDLVDKVGAIKPLLPKARMFLQYLPAEFLGGFDPDQHAPYMRINFPGTGSRIMGEGGDQIGRGDRASLYFVDEAAHLANAESVEMALSQTTNCRIDMSSVNGMNNTFAKKRHEGKVDVFVFDWRDDPRKDQAWYDRQVEDLDPVTVAQEIDRDYSASTEGIVIPGRWVRAALNACERLGITPSGYSGVALDVADEGVDKNALVGATGVEIDLLKEWSGVGGDIFATVQTTFGVCDEFGLREFRYDADGLGAGVRGDARIINEARMAAGIPQIRAIPYRGSEGVQDPDKQWDPDNRAARGTTDQRSRTNKDMFANRKAQEAWRLRRRFQLTYRWVEEGIECDPDEIVSINTRECGDLWKKLVRELSQPTFKTNGAGKILIEKKADATRSDGSRRAALPSPNLYDGTVMHFAKLARGVVISDDVLAAAARAPRRGAGR